MRTNKESMTDEQPVTLDWLDKAFSRKPTLRIRFARLWCKIKSAYWAIIYFFQRLYKGYDYVDVFNCGPSLVSIIYPRLRAFRDMKGSGHPGGCSSLEQWEQYLDQMVLACELWILDEMECAFYPPFNGGERREVWDNIDYGFKLFGTYLLSLWD